MSYLQQNYPNAGGNISLCMYGNTTYSIFNGGSTSNNIIYHVIDNTTFTDISFNVVVGGSFGGSNARALITDGTFLYVTSATATIGYALIKIQIGLTSIDASYSDPSGNNYNSLFYGAHAVTNGTYIWLMNFKYNTVDVYTCASLALVSKVLLPSGNLVDNNNGGICINNSTVFLADTRPVSSQYKLCYINVSDPTTLIQSTVSLNANAVALAIDSSYIWVSTGNGLRRYNAASPYTFVDSLVISGSNIGNIVSNGIQVWVRGTSTIVYGINCTGSLSVSTTLNTPLVTKVQLAVSSNNRYLFTSNSDNSLTEFYLPYYCFKEGTKILTIDGYVPIQDLRQGDLVKTLKHNYVSINMIGKSTIYNSGNSERIKNRLYRCSKREYKEVFEDLIITGCHSILVDEFVSNEQRDKAIKVNGIIYLTDDQYRLPAMVDDRAVPYEKEGDFTIYHFALDNDDYYMNYGIYANGLLVESCSKRMMKEIAGMQLIE